MNKYIILLAVFVCAACAACAGERDYVPCDCINKSLEHHLQILLKKWRDGANGQGTLDSAALARATANVLWYDSLFSGKLFSNTDTLENAHPSTLKAMEDALRYRGLGIFLMENHVGNTNPKVLREYYNTDMKNIRNYATWILGTDKYIGRSSNYYIVCAGEVPDNEQAFYLISQITGEVVSTYKEKITWRSPSTSECEKYEDDFAAVPADAELSWKSGAATAALSRDGTLRVSGKGAMKDYDYGRFAKEFRFTAAGASVFDSLSPLYLPPWAYSTGLHRAFIRKLVIEEGVTHIGNDAFRDLYYLTSVTLPKSLKTIGKGAFAYCQYLESAAIPAGVTAIGDMAFSNCTSLKSVTIPNTVTHIGEQAFENCYNCYHQFASVVIPNSVKHIGKEAFYACSMKSVTIPGSVTFIGEMAFAGGGALIINVAPDNANYASEGGVLFNKDKTVLIQYPPERKGYSYAVPDGVTTIGQLAFDRNGLTSVTLPGNVTFMERRAFFRCDNMERLIVRNPIPPKVRRDALYGISGRARLYVPKGSIGAYRAADEWKRFENIGDGAPPD